LRGKKYRSTNVEQKCTVYIIIPINLSTITESSSEGLKKQKNPTRMKFTTRMKGYSQCR